MKSFSFPKALTLGCLLCLSVPVACGDDESNPPKPSPSDAGAGGEVTGTGGLPSVDGGAGGAGPAIMLPGTSTTSQTIECGTSMCKSTSTLLPTLFVDPCCVDDACGVDTQFLGLLKAAFPAGATCQPKAQAGDLDAACPDSAEQMVMVPGVPAAVPVPGFAGCCRADTGTCGVVVDTIPTSFGNFASPGLGCVDSAPFFGQKAGAACGAGGGGTGGAGGVSGGGAPTTDAGAPSSGGAGGAGGAVQ